MFKFNSDEPETLYAQQNLHCLYHPFIDMDTLEEYHSFIGFCTDNVRCPFCGTVEKGTKPMCIDCRYVFMRFCKELYNDSMDFINY